MAWLERGRLARLRQKQETSFTPIFLHRPLAILLLIPLADVRWITPNLLTTANIVLRLIAAGLLWPDDLGGLAESTAKIAAAVFLWHLGGTLDAADGTLARYRGEGTLFGRYYDKVSDRLVTLALVLALAARAYAATQGIHVLVLAMLYVAMMSATSVAKWIHLGLMAELEPARKKAVDPDERPAPERTVAQWALYVLWSLRYAPVITEMDLPLWGSIAVLVGREEWLLWYLGAFGVIYGCGSIAVRGVKILRADRGRPSAQ